MYTGDEASWLCTRPHCGFLASFQGTAHYLKGLARDPGGPLQALQAHLVPPSDATLQAEGSLTVWAVHGFIGVLLSFIRPLQHQPAVLVGAVGALGGGHGLLQQQGVIHLLVAGTDAAGSGSVTCGS